MLSTHPRWFKFFVTCVAMVLLSPLAVSAADLSITPNDPFWDKQWYLRQIHAPEAWAVTTGTSNVVVAVIDGGVDITHPDLKDNIWTNDKEIPGDGIDNDHDGFVDDVHGWNFVTNSPDVRPVYKAVQQEDAWSHGTLVASLIGAKGNEGVGIAGVTWNVRLMPVVVLDGDGAGQVTNVVRAARYAVNHGANVINLSLVGYEYDEELDLLIRNAAAAGVVIVAATGNDDFGKNGINIDEAPAYPACMDGGNNIVLGVSGTDTLDQKAPYANYGKLCTDIAAPAQELFGARPSYPHNATRATSTVTGYIDKVTGTSLATPLVSGVAALIKSVRPDWTAAQIRERIRLTADAVDDNLPTNEKGALGYGRLNAGRALAGLSPMVVASSVQPTQPSFKGLGPWTTSTVTGVDGTIWSLFTSRRSASVTLWNPGQGINQVWQPYGPNYRAGIQQAMLDASGKILLWPTLGGGQALVVDVSQNGKVINQSFPFPKAHSGAWEMIGDRVKPGSVIIRGPNLLRGRLYWDGMVLKSL